LQQAKTLLEKVNIYELKIQADIAQNQMQAAIDTGLKVLEILGVEFKYEHPKELIIEDLADLPAMTDPYQLATLRVLHTLISPAYIANPNLLSPIVLTTIDLCIKYGNSPLSSYTYAFYGLFLCGVMEDINSGYRFGQLGVRLFEQFNARELKAKILNAFNGYTRHWKEPLRETIEPLQEAIQSGLETGDIEIAGYAVLNYCDRQFFGGENLESVDRNYEQYITLLQKLNLEYHLVYGRIGRQITLNLLARADNNSQLIGEAFNETEMLPILKENQNKTSLFYAYLAKSILQYFFKESVPAIASAREAEKYQESATGLITVAQHNFYYSLALLANYFNADKREQSEFSQQITANQKKLKNWADHAPSNFQHKYELIEAEKARVLGLNWEAGQLYDRAIREATEQGYLHEEALANELAAEFYLSCGKEKIAQTYLTDAYYGYVRWGAVAKVKDLEARYPQFLSSITTKEITDIQENLALSSTATVSLATLDLYAILKASQAISQEIILNSLTDKLMKILLENAGAKTGFLILLKEGKLVVEIAGSLAVKGITLRQSIPVEISQQLPVSVINYVARTKESLILDDSAKDSTWASDRYIQQYQPKSILCAPILKQGKLIGIIYLENNLINRAFSGDRQQVVSLLCAQAAISLENANLYQSLQQSQVRERVEKQIRKALEKEKELTELKSRFISMASHEFRTPLTAILSTAELLRYYGQNWSEEKKQSYYDRISKAVQQMNQLLEDVLFLGKAEAGKLAFQPSPMDLNQFCRNLVEECQLLNKTEQTIVFSSQGEGSGVAVDEKLLRHILGNLLSNAIKYSPADSNIEFRLNCQEKEAIFQVRDRGIGIPKEDLPRLFESFHRAKNVGKISGTGLGLAIVKRSVDLHGGKILVNSAVGVGTTFTVTIPLTR
jgi:signal transduction histidine kinase